MAHLTSRIALACVLAGTPLALSAQSTDTPVEEAVVEGAVEGVDDDMSQSTEVDTELSDTQMTAETDATAPEGAEVAKPVEGQILLQSENTILAHDFLGKTIYSGTEENIGDINDMIVSLDGRIDGVVIGVGGFLGIGEKEVAVQMDQIRVVSIDNGGTRLLLDASKADLEAAAPFQSVQDQKLQAEMEAAQAQAETGNTLATTTNQSN